MVGAVYVHVLRTLPPVPSELLAYQRKNGFNIPPNKIIWMHQITRSLEANWQGHFLK